MKRLAVTILAVLYLLASSGATIHLHYCMGQLVELGMAAKTSGECGKCGMEKGEPASGNGCCNDEQQELKIKVDQNAVTAFQGFPLDSIDMPVVSKAIASPLLLLLTTSEPLGKAPLRSNKLPLHITNSVFLI